MRLKKTMHFALQQVFLHVLLTLMAIIVKDKYAYITEEGQGTVQ